MSYLFGCSCIFRTYIKLFTYSIILKINIYLKKKVKQSRVMLRLIDITYLTHYNLNTNKYKGTGMCTK